MKTFADHLVASKINNLLETISKTMVELEIDANNYIDTYIKNEHPALLEAGFLNDLGQSISNGFRGFVSGMQNNAMTTYQNTLTSMQRLSAMLQRAPQVRGASDLYNNLAKIYLDLQRHKDTITQLDPVLKQNGMYGVQGNQHVNQPNRPAPKPSQPYGGDNGAVS